MKNNETPPPPPERNRIIQPPNSGHDTSLSLEIRNDGGTVLFSMNKATQMLRLHPDAAIHMATNILIQAHHAKQWNQAKEGEAGV